MACDARRAVLGCRVHISPAHAAVLQHSPSALILQGETMRLSLRIAIVGCLAATAGAALVAAPTNVWWGQWGRSPVHDGFVPVAGQTGSNILANIVYDPFTD